MIRINWFKKKYKIIAIVIACLVVIPLLLLSGVTLYPERERQSHIVIPVELKEQIKKDTKNMTVKDIIKYSKRQTKRLLWFSPISELGETIDINRVTGTHCVGYATVLNAICNYALMVNHKKAKCYHVVGTVKVYGIDLCKVVSSMFRSVGFTIGYNFTKDHDFCKIRSGDKNIYADASLPFLCWNGKTM